MASSDSFFVRLQNLDIRAWAAVAAALLLIGGVMWVVPTTPNSQSFTFDAARRGMESARPLELAMPIQGSIVDGSDADFYRITPLKASYRLDVHLANGSPKMIPGLRVFDAARNLVLDKSPELIRAPGGSVDGSFIAQSSMTYFVQIFGQRNTTGPYTLTVSVRQP
jgi:hypothetical protein